MTLLELCENYKSEQWGAYLADCEVCSLAVSQDKQTMICQVRLATPLSRATIDEIGSDIAKKYQIQRFTVAPQYDMQTLTDEYLSVLRDDLFASYPSAEGLLNSGIWRYENKEIQIAMDEPAQQYLHTALRLMQDRIEAETSLRVAVMAVPMEATAVEQSLVEQREIRAQALSAVSVPISMEEKPKPKSKPKVQTGEKTYRQKAEAVPESDLIFGKIYAEPVIAVRDALEEFDRVTIEGDIFFADHKEIKSKKSGKEWLKVAFDITDNTNSIRVSKFMDKESGLELASELKKGMYVRIQGKITYDTYEKERILEPTAIIKAKKKVRMDNAPEKRVELHLHTNMSAMDGVSDVSALIKRAKAWGHPAMAITDHGCVQAFPLALHVVEGKEADFPKIIYGVEAYYVDDSARVAVVRGDKTYPLNGRFIIFDLETTGLKPAFEEITEIAATLVEHGEIKDSFQTYVNPNKPIPEKITELTGITDDMVADAPQLAQALQAFFAFAQEDILVAHNAGFDLSFLRAGCEKCAITRAFTYIDTLELSRILMPDQGRYKLNNLAKALAVGPFNHHRASEDAAVLARIWLKLVEKLQIELHAKTVSDINPALAGLRAKTGSLKNLPRMHFIVLVKNLVGRKNLYKLISQSYLDYFNKRPIMPKSALIKHREGLIFGTACEAGELFKAVVAGENEQKLMEIASFYDFLEIQPIGNNQFMIAKGIAENEETLRNYNRTIVSLAERMDKPCCATGDVHFLDPQDEVYRRILMAGQGFGDADNQPPLYLKTTEEMLDEFAYLGEQKAYEVVVKNTNLVADWCENIRPTPKENFEPKMEGAVEEFEMLCRTKAEKMYGNPLPALVQKRLEHELKCIIDNGYAVLYMIAQKLVAKSLEDGYLVGSRGSVGSSFAAFLSDITEVNSLAPHYLCPECKYFELHENEGVGCGVCLPDKVCPQCGAELGKEGFSIPFETFLGFKGDKVPDIDLNFSGEYQSRIHYYTGELFGHDHVFRAGTIATVAEKTAFGYVKKYMEERGMECSRAEENRLSAGCTGIRRTTGQHPGGIVVVPQEIEIYDVCPIQHPADDPTSPIITTHFEYHSIDSNLLKLDELGHDDPTMIRHLENLTGVNAQGIALDDAGVMSLFTSNKALKYVDDTPDPILGDLGCLAVPEFGTKFVRGMVRDTTPASFDDLVSISGLSHGTDVWLGNAQTLVESGVPLNECICCRDDIMNYLMGKGVDPLLSFKIMESVRKGKGVAEDWEVAMRAENVPDWYIDSCKKIKYMFPKAHAVAYVMMAYRIAWFKVYHPLAFYSAYFSIRAKGFDASCMARGDAVCLEKMRELRKKEQEKTISNAESDMQTTLEVCHEFYKRGFVFESMDIYQSDASAFLVTEKGLIPPFSSMPGVGDQAALNIVEERKNGAFMSSEEIVVRCAKVSKGVVELLEQMGALGDMPKSTQISLF